MTTVKNRVNLIGNLGADPEALTFESGRIVKFPIAVSEAFKKGDDWEERTQWFKCQCTSFVADKVEKYYSKGMKVFVEGRLKMNKWTAKDGTERMDFIIEVHTTHHFAPSAKPETTRTPVTEPVLSKKAEDEETDDLPF
jgi:single-strand DNA-binding protein